jgi:hyperosmotically inducible protein
MKTAIAVLSVALSLPTVALSQEKDLRTKQVESEVQHQLLMLPYYTVFDSLAFRVEPGGTVRLLGQVVKPTLKSDAERRVKGVSGVDTVINEIEVLPTSPADDRIRFAVYRTIYRTEVLERYGFQAQPSIHIVVKNGRVTLEGVVDSEQDKTVAGLKAREVGGVFEVKNNLAIER